MNLAYIALSDKVESIPFLTDGAVEWENDPLAGVLVDNGKLKRSELYQMQEVPNFTRCRKYRRRAPRLSASRWSSSASSRKAISPRHLPA
jgi:hypothetical protein